MRRRLSPSPGTPGEGRGEGRFRQYTREARATTEQPDGPHMPVTRYHRQQLLPQVGPAGQARLAAARVLLVGCGALGTTLADLVVRAGVGFLRIADRDVVELTNLQRQVLFDESDARQGAPKAVAAARRLAAINADVTIEPHVVDVHAANLPDLAGLEGAGPPCDLLLDGTDNVETRYLLNDLAVKHAIPWVYGACVGTEGRVMGVLPGTTACLRCIYPAPPAVGEFATCDTAGVLGPAAAVVAATQAALALRLLIDRTTPEHLLTFDLWAGRFHAVPTTDVRSPDCPCCGQRRFEFLNAPLGPGLTTLCGRNAVQIRTLNPTRAAPLDLSALAGRLKPSGQVESTRYLVRCHLHEPAGLSLTVFADGRILVHGTNNPNTARSVAARFVGA